MRALAGLLLCLAPSLACAQSLPETEWGEPWNGVGFGARALGMGGAYTAVADDFDGAYWNPGGLVRLRDTQIGFMTGDGAWGRKPTADSVRSSLPYLNGIGFWSNAFKPWAMGVAAIRNFHSESLIPWQDDFYMGTFVLPLNQPRTAGLGVNVKYLFSDYHFAHPLYNIDGDPIKAGIQPIRLNEEITGWATDVGLYFSIPLPLRDRRREINIGAMGRNLVGRSRQGNTERILPSAAQFGLSFVFDDLVPRERSLITVNYDQALKATLKANQVVTVGGTDVTVGQILDTQFRVGFEQWFYQNNLGIRIGYASPLPRYLPQASAILNPVSVGEGSFRYEVQGRPVWTAGMSVTAFKFQVNFAVTVPVETVKADTFPEVPETPRLNSADPVTGADVTKAVDRTRFYFEVVYHLGVAATSPYAKVRVEPLVFAPKKGEVAVFNIDWKDDRGIEFWALEIKNSARVPVRTYQGRGAPPERLVWDGLDDRFNLAGDDDHTYTLTIRNRDRIETVTAPQQVKVFTPEDQSHKTLPDITPLRRISEENLKHEAEDKARTRPLIQGQIRDMKTPLAGEPPAASGAEPGGGGAPELPGDVPVPPGGPESATVGAESSTTAFETASYRGIAPAQILRLEVPTRGTSGQQAILDYQTQTYVLKYLIREVQSLTEQTFDNVGASAGSFLVQARYGNHLLSAETPMEVCRGLKAGRLDDRQWLRSARITLDGQQITPSLD